MRNTHEAQKTPSPYSPRRRSLFKQTQQAGRPPLSDDTVETREPVEDIWTAPRFNSLLQRTSPRERRKVTNPEYLTGEQIKQNSDIFGSTPVPDFDTGSEYNETIPAFSRTQSQTIVPEIRPTSATQIANERIPMVSEGPEGRPVNLTVEDGGEGWNNIDDRVESEVPPSTLDEAHQADKSSTQTSPEPHVDPPLSPPLSSYRPPPLPSQSSPVEIHYWIVHRTSSCYQLKKWQPIGNFQEKSLQSLIKELPIQGDISSLELKLFGKGIKMEASVGKNNESKLRHFQSHIRKGVQNAIRTREDITKPLELQVDIEPIFSKIQDGGVNSGSISFDW
jgi:hypothetical protein